MFYEGWAGGGANSGNQSLNLSAANKLADLSITKTDSPDPVIAGNDLTYTIVVTNNGPNQATAATVTDTIPTGTTFVSITSSQGTRTGTTTRTCNLGVIDAGSFATITLVVNVNVGTTGTVSNTATKTTSTPTDPTAGNNSATATTTVNAPNTAPVAINDTATTNEDTPYMFPASGAGSLKVNDTDTTNTNGQLTLTSVTDPPNGTAVLNLDGSVTYTPDPNYFGSDTFNYTVCDPGQDGNAATTGDNLCDVGAVTMTVTSVNDAPSGADNTVTTTRTWRTRSRRRDFGFTDPNDTPANTLAAVMITTLATNGKVQAERRGRDGRPGILGRGHHGREPEVRAGCQRERRAVRDLHVPGRDNGGTANGGVDLDPTPNTMTVNVTPVNDAPSGADNTVTTLEDTAYTFAAATSVSGSERQPGERTGGGQDHDAGDRREGEIERRRRDGRPGDLGSRTSRPAT